MKKILGILILLSCQVFFGQNTLDISSASIPVNNNFSLAVGLENSEAVAAFQFDIVYNGDAIDLSTGHTLTERGTNHSLSTSNIDSNTIRVLVYSSSNQLIAVGDGAVVNLNFISKNLPGTYALTITNIVLSDVNGLAITASGSNGQATVLGPKYNLVTTAINFGEVPIQSNPTRNITISNDGNEALEVSSYTLAAPFSISTAFPITIAAGASVSLTVNIATTVKQNATKQAVFVTNDTNPLRKLQNTSITANIYAVNEIYIGSGSGEINTNITIPVSISNMEPFNGFQFDLTLPTDITYVSNSVAFSGRETDHTIVGSMVNTNTLRILAYSPTNSNFSNTTGEVLTFKLIPTVNSGTYPLTILSPIISNTTLDDIESGSYAGSISINAPNLNLSNSNFNLGRVPITSQVVKDITLSNTGTANLIIDAVVYNSETLTSTITTPLTISANQNTSKNLTFSPNVLGQFSSSISVRHNGAAEQNVIQVTADVFTPNYLLLEEKSIYINEDNTVKLVLSNNDNVKAIQFDVNIPDGFVFDYQNTTSEAVLDNFQFSSSDLGNGNFRFIIYTVSNSVIPSGTNTILNLPVFVNSTTALGDYDFALSNIVISNTANQNAASEALETNVIHVIENSAPVAVDDTVTVLEDAALSSIDIIANDTDVDALTVTEVTYAGSGTVAINNNKIDYTPAANFNGTETVSYTVSDGALTDVGTLTIIVTAVNDDPIAFDDSTTVLEDAALSSIDVIVNDTDIEDDTLIVTEVTYTGTGTVAINNNKIEYTPAANFNGTETITYTLSDGALTDVGTLTITVTAMNDAPVAMADAATVLEDAALSSIDVIANDTDIEDDPLTVTVVSTDGTGTVAITNNKIEYTPAANFNGTETITYTISDGSLTGVGTLTITVTAVNDAPVAIDDSITVLEDAELTSIDVISNDTDIEDDTLSVTVVSTDGTGIVAITDNKIDYTPAANFNGTETVSYTVSDGSLTDVGTLTIIVTAVNDAPVAVDDVISLEKGDSNTVILTATDIDNDDLTYSIVDQPSHGSVTLDGDQATYTTTNATYTGADSFTFTASDGNLTSNIATITIDVTLDVLSYSLDNIKSYPNPFNEFYIIESVIPLKLEVYDINGKIILKKQLVSGKNKINGTNLSRGYYIFKFKAENRSNSKVLIKY